MSDPRFDVTSSNPPGWLACVWAALEQLPEGTLTDDERDNVSTAMAWIAEEMEIDPADMA